jgi:signal transduction histidine kinase
VNKKIFFIINLFIFCFHLCFTQVKTDSIQYYIELNKPFNALSYTKRIADSYLKEKQYHNYCLIMYKRAELFEDLNDSENALKTLFEYAKIAEKQKLDDDILKFNLKAANLNITNFNFSNAKKFLNKAKKIANRSKSNNKLRDTYQVFFRFHSISESDSAKYYLNKIEILSLIDKDPYVLAKFYNNSFAYYTSINDFEKSKKYIEKLIDLTPSLKDNKIKNIAFTNYGSYLIQVEKNYSKAIEIYKFLLKSLKEGEDIKSKSEALLNISAAYELLGNYKKAMEYNNMYLEVRELINSGKIKSITQEIETKYQLEKAEEEFKNKTQAILYKQKRNQKIIYLLAALFILLGGISYFYYQNLKLKQYNKLKDINSDLQGKIISATIDGQEQERVKISEILHDSVSATLSSVGLHLSAFESSLNDEQRDDLKKTRSLLKQAHDKVRDLSHELVPPLLVKFGLQFALRDLCENHSNSLIKFHFSSELPNTKKFKHDLEIKLYYIVSELFNNAIKHSKASDVHLKLYEDNRKKLVLSVEDNGKGFNAKETQLGFGLTQIKARVKNMKGNIKIESEDNQGTKITIELPQS